MVSVKTFVVSAILSLVITRCSCAATPTTDLHTRITKGGFGEDNGFYWNFWTDGSGGVNYENGPEGTYAVSWNGSLNFIGGKGWNPGTKDRIITYSGDFKANGNGYLCIYGWSKDPTFEYYIIEWFGTYDPTSMFSNNASRKVTIEADGGTYAIGRYRYVGMGLPPPIKDQIYSVREAKDRRTAGTVNMKLHFDAWEQKLGVKFGTLDYQIVGTEGYLGSGEAKIKVEKAV